MATASPFDGFQNGVIYLSFPSGSTTIDSNGNTIQGKSVQACQVLLEQTSDFHWQKLPGIDLGDIPVKGYFVDPQYLPANVALPGRYPCTRNTLTGEILLYPVIRDPWGVSLEAGDPIRGYFRVGGYKAINAKVGQSLGLLLSLTNST